MLAFAFWVSIANDSLFVVYGAWLEQDFQVGITTLGFSTVAIGAAELLGESMTALFADRMGLKKTIIIGLCLTMTAYMTLSFSINALWLALVGMFFVFLAFEFTIVTSFSLSTELIAESRATMMAGFYATAGLGRMIGVLIGGWLWHFGGITAVALSSMCMTGLALLSLIWGMQGWTGKEISRQ
jgi:predicted MFS family arabinose efflux permease